MLQNLKQHSHIATYWLIPHHLGLILVLKVARMVYLAYIHVPNTADSAKFEFKFQKSPQIQNIAQPPPL